MKQAVKQREKYAILWIAIIVLWVISILSLAFLTSAYLVSVGVACTFCACLHIWICTRGDSGHLTSRLLMSSLAFVVAAVVMTSGWATLPFAIVLAFGLLWSHNSLSERFASPEIYYGLVRLGRRGRSSWVRILFLVGALAGLVFAFQTRTRFLGQGWFDPGPGVSLNSMAELGQSYAFALFTVQNFAVFLLTPIYLGGAIVEERDRRTLDMLLTTHLTEGQIVFGKFLSRILYLGAVMAAGVPLLSFMLFWGGVDMGLVAANYLNTLLNLATVGVLSILISSRARTALRGTLLCYAILFPVVVIWEIVAGETHSLFVARPGPFGAFWTSLSGLGTIRANAAIVLSMWCLGRTVQQLRERRAEDLPPEEPIVREEAQITVNDGSIWAARPPIGDNALLWKERYLYRTLHPGTVMVFAPVIGLVLIFFLIGFMGRISGEGFEGFNVFIFYASTVLIFPCAGFCVLSVALGTAMSFAWERHRATLDNLLTLPVERRELLFAVASGNVLRRGSWLWLISVFLAIGALSGALHPLGAGILAASLLAHLIFFVGFGLFISVVSMNTLQAGFRMGVLILSLVVLPLAAGMIWPARPDDFWKNLATYGVNPVGTWMGSYFGWKEFAARDDAFVARLQVMGLGITLYALAGVVFGLLAWWRLERKCG